MHIKTKTREIFVKAVNGLVVVGLVALTIFGISAGFSTVLADSPMLEGATPNGGINYGSLTTHIYRVNDGSGGAPCWNNGSGCYTSHAMCLEPTKASHVGDYGSIGYGSNPDVVKIMLVTDAAVNPTIYNAFKSTGMDLESLGSYITSTGSVSYGGGTYTAGQARAFVVGHVLAGAAYTGTAYVSGNNAYGSFAGINSSYTSYFLQAYATIINWFNSNYSDAPAQYTLVNFYPNDSSHQTVGWLYGSYTPTPVVQKGYIQLLKYDAATGYNAALNGTGVLSGATFRVYNQSSSGTTLATRTTGSNGYTPLYEADAGQTICFVETSPPNGYNINTNPQCATIQANSTSYLSLANTKQTGTIRLLKYDAATGQSAPLSGATFRLYEQGNSGTTLATKTTDSTGYTSAYTAEAGKTICFVETSAPTGYVPDTTPKCNTIVGNSTVYVYLGNTMQSLHGGVRVRKIDSETNNGNARGSAKVEGTVFTVYNSDSNGTVGSSTGVTLTANATGYATTSASALSIDPVAGGSWYCVRETTAGPGYNLSDTSCKKFYLSSDGVIYDLTGSPFADTPIRGSLTITKQRSIYTSVTHDWSNIPFAGITFTLVNNADSNIAYQTDATDSNGVVTLNNILYGTYTVTENRVAMNEAYELETFTITISSQGQTVTKSVLNELTDVPFIDTTARNTNSNPDDKNNPAASDKEIEIDDAAGVTDYTNYSGLQAGADYRVEGELWKINPPQVRITTKTHDFTAGTGGSGSFDLHFDTIDTTEYIGETLGIIQKLYKKNSNEWLLLTEHNLDFTNTKQTVTVVNLGLSTTATDDIDNDHIIEPTRAQIVKDQVVYQNLVQGRDYILAARLIDKAATQEAGETKVLRINGTEVPAIVTKITMPEAVEGSTTVRFNVNATDIPGKELVVYERLYEYVEGVSASNWEEKLTDLVISHEDLNDTDQTVKVRPRIGTTAVEKSDNNHVVGAGMTTIVDTVSLEGLSKERYRLIGYVVEKKGESGGNTEDTPIVAPVGGGSSTTIRAEKVIDLRSASEIPTSAEMEFTFDTRAFAGKDLVVYEELYRIESNGANTLITWHKDPSDTKQTIKVSTPKIQTTATNKEDGHKELALNAEVTITDEIKYEGLVAGNTYTLVGELRDKKNGEVIEMVDGSTKVIHVFEAEGENGTENMDFAIKTKNMAGREIVVFEELYFGEWIVEEKDEETEEVITPEVPLTEDDLIAIHKDLSSAKQTVRVLPEKPDTGFISRDAEPEETFTIPVVAVVVAFGLSSAIVIGVIVGVRAYKRSHNIW